MQWPAKCGNLSSCLLFTPVRTLNVCLYSGSALCKVIYLCRVCCVSIKSRAQLSKLELNEKFFSLGTNKVNLSYKMNLNFCRVVLLGIVSHYFLQDFIRIVTVSPSWGKKKERDFLKFLHLLFFKTNWMPNNGNTSRSRNRFCSSVLWAVTCRGFISGWLKITCAFPLCTCFTSMVLHL